MGAGLVHHDVTDGTVLARLEVPENARLADWKQRMHLLVNENIMVNDFNVAPVVFKPQNYNEG